MQLKEKFFTRSQKKYEKMVDKHKPQGENISDENYTGKNHVKLFSQIEINMYYNKDIKYFKILNEKLNKEYRF